MKTEESWNVKVGVDGSDRHETVTVITEKLSDAIMAAIRAAVDDDRITERSYCVELHAWQGYTLRHK